MVAGLKNEISNYISSEGLTDLYPILVNQVKLCEARNSLVEDSSRSCRKYLTDVQNSSFSADSIIKLQVTQLDIISKLFMFMEDFLTFSYYLHTSKKELHRKIQSQNNVVWNEINYLENLDIDQNPRIFIISNDRGITYFR